MDDDEYFKRKDYANYRDLINMTVKVNACSHCGSPFKLISNYGAMYPQVWYNDDDFESYFCSDECRAKSEPNRPIKAT
jgi:hypothetical protein